MNQNENIQVEQLRLSIVNGKRQKTTTTSMRLFLSKPLLQHIIDTMPQDKTPSERIVELITIGLKVEKCGMT